MWRISPRKMNTSHQSPLQEFSNQQKQKADGLKAAAYY